MQLTDVNQESKVNLNWFSQIMNFYFFFIK